MPAGQVNHLPPSAPKPQLLKDAPMPVVEAVERVSRGQAKIEHVFEGPMNLIGMAVQVAPGRNMIMYASKDGQYLIMGGIFGPNGQNYTMAAAQAYLPPPPPPPNVGKNYDALKKTHTYVWGKASAKKTLWAVFDPDCIFCHKLFGELQPYVDKGDVKVHVIQVGFLKPDALGKAAAIMSSKDPAAELVKDETKFDESTEEGGIAPNTNDAKAVSEVKANNQWMSGHGIGGTPYVLYLQKNGKPGVLPGFTSDVASLLSQVKSE